MGPVDRAATRKLAGRNVCRVYLLDNTMKTFLVDDDATAGVRVGVMDVFASTGRSVY